MKLSIFSILLALLVTCALAQTQSQKAVMVSYKQNTPNSVLDRAKEAIRQAGGVVTHDFSKNRCVSLLPSS